MDYFEKIENKPDSDLTWNLPEQRSGNIKIVGGNGNSFRTEIKTAEFLYNNYPVETPTLVFPDNLKNKLPNLSNIIYAESTDSGSFANAKTLSGVMARADYNLLLGDLSKNKITAQVIGEVLKDVEVPTLVTRDAVDLVAEYKPELMLMNSNVAFFASMPQLIKLFRAVYYPKMLLLSQSLIQVADALHKFTLSYPAKIVTLHAEQILVAEDGVVKAVPLAKSGYLPVTFWNGELAAKIVALSLFNPNKFMNATLCAIFS